MFKDPADVEAKTGRDDKLEAEANKLLTEGVGENKRSLERDVEKMLYESGQKSVDELEHYDPDNDWHAQDSAYAVLVNPADIPGIEPTICDMDDGNARVRNPKLRERQILMRHVDDTDSWGSAREFIPLLGVNDVRPKICTRCKLAKRTEYFSPDPRKRDGLQAWCKQCRKEVTSQQREKRRGNADK